MAKHLTRKKARKILSDGSVRGNPLTMPQRGFFGARAAGLPIRKSQRAEVQKRLSRRA